MPSDTDPDWTRLGELLMRRRIELDPRYSNRRVFTDERIPGKYRIVNSVERGQRDNYEPGTIAALEAAYALEPGAISRFLAGGELEPPPPVILPRPRSEPVRPVLDFSKAEPGLKPFTQQVLGEIYTRIGFPPGTGPGREVPELPQDAAALPGRFLFSDDREAEMWDDPRIPTVGEKVRTIALKRKISTEWGEGRRRTGLERPGGTAARLFRVARRAGSTPH